VAAIAVKDNAKATWPLPGIAGVRAQVRGMVQRVVGYAAAAVMICAVGAALFQLGVQIASFPAPVAVTAFTLLAMALFRSLRRHRALNARYGRAVRRGGIMPIPGRAGQRRLPRPPSCSPTPRRAEPGPS
jgi:hypothetical protein